MTAPPMTEVQVELGEPAAAVGSFEQRSGEPQGKHAEEDADDPLLRERVGKELPDLSSNHGERLEDEMAEEKVGDGGGKPGEDGERKEDADVEEDQLSHGAREGRQCHRDGTGTRHGFLTLLFHHSCVTPGLVGLRLRRRRRLGEVPHWAGGRWEDSHAAVAGLTYGTDSEDDVVLGNG